MTDPQNAHPGSYGTSGRGSDTGEETRWTSESGRTSARPNRSDVTNPAGWFPPPAGEAAPPVRPREPARSDVPYNVETRPTSMYRVPWRSPRPQSAQRPLRTPQLPVARPRRSMPSGNASAPDSRWPSLTRPGPRPVPVVGPTEALHGRAGGPGVDVPPGAVPGLLGHGRQSGWQLAQRVWQDSGVGWEEPGVDWADSGAGWADAPSQAGDTYAPGYGADEYSADPYATGRYAPDWDAPAPDLADRYAPDWDGPAPDPADQYAPDWDGPAPDPADQYAPDPHGALGGPD